MTHNKSIAGSHVCSLPDGSLTFCDGPAYCRRCADAERRKERLVRKAAQDATKIKPLTSNQVKVLAVLLQYPDKPDIALIESGLKKHAFSKGRSGLRLRGMLNKDGLPVRWLQELATHIIASFFDAHSGT